jgi:hypothetical protein
MRTSFAFVVIGFVLSPLFGAGIANAQASSDTSGAVSGQAKSDEPTMGAGSRQLPSPNSEDQGGTGIKGSAQSEGATNKDTAPRDTVPQ